MGRGRSKAGGGGAGSNINAPTKNISPTVSTPSGVTYDQFMQMDMSERLDLLDDIINDQNITVPVHLDDSVTSKIMYALGMDKKPTVVSDAQLDSMNGTDIYRAVYDAPTIDSKGILDQIRTGDYTQLSGSGGSRNGRAIYFAQKFKGAAIYGRRGNNALVMRAKINDGANVIAYDVLDQKMRYSSLWRSHNISSSTTYSAKNRDDAISIFAIANGYDGWSSSTYTMILNRGILSTSSQNRRIYDNNGNIGVSWRSAVIAP